MALRALRQGRLTACGQVRSAAQGRGFAFSLHIPVCGPQVLNQVPQILNQGAVRLAIKFTIEIRFTI
jgi:hypothetical protein